MKIDIADFLPKYPNISKYKENVLNPYSGDFYKVIYNKKEFYDDKLDIQEEVPKEPGILMNHQKLISKFLSSYTMYNELLLFHEMGVGKTCTAISVIEENRLKGNFKKALYLAKGTDLLNNVTDELMFKCTDGRYIPENYDELTELEKKHRKTKILKEFYELSTFEIFSKFIQSSSDNVLIKNYSNTIIVIDEVHNLRIERDMYNSIHRFLHIVKDCKILLMSGTPMKDGVDEIASVMNLILPLDKQLVTGKKFLETYFLQNNKLNLGKVNELKDHFKGRVSYLKAMKSNVKKVFVGKKIGKLKYFKVAEDRMSPFQSNIYNKAYDLDSKEDERSGVYINSRQSSLFVYPDGTYGEDGFQTYIKREKIRIASSNSRYKYKYRMKKELSNVLLQGANTNEEILMNIQKYSSKYAATIRNILQAHKDGKSVFVYNEYVQGSGLILFTQLLTLFGFVEASGNESEGDEKMRFASLTALTTSKSKLKKLINRFNQPDNMNGKIINVILGSKKISEGFTLKNVQVEEILTPWYNYSETSQVIARGYRLGSHIDLEQNGITPVLDIYQRVSLNTTGTNPSVDLEMYELSEDKDILIKQMERILKTSAWDCSLTYLRNNMVGYDNQRECDYMNCEYTCDGITTNLNKQPATNKNLDYSTYQLFYNTESINRIVDKILNIFRKIFFINIDNLITYFKDDNYSNFEIITAIIRIINENKKIVNKYGFISYLREDKNTLFLVNSLNTPFKVQFLSYYYSKYPCVKKVNKTFSDIIKPFTNLSITDIVKNIFKIKNSDELNKLIILLPDKTKLSLLEYSLLATKLKKTLNQNVRSFILKYFENFYKEINGILVIWLLYDKLNLIKCLNKNNNWIDCTTKYSTIIDNLKQNILDKLENNKYGYYGQFNKDTNEFCIRDVSDVIPERKHQRTSGKRCVNWNKQVILPIILNKLKLPIPDENKIIQKDNWNKMKNLNRNKLINQLKTNKYTKSYYNDNMNTQELLRILFWGKQQIKSICTYLRDWFDSKGLLIEDPGCGITTKIKI